MLNPAPPEVEQPGADLSPTLPPQPPQRILAADRAASACGPEAAATALDILAMAAGSGGFMPLLRWAPAASAGSSDMKGRSSPYLRIHPRSIQSFTVQSQEPCTCRGHQLF